MKSLRFCMAFVFALVLIVTFASVGYAQTKITPGALASGGAAGPKVYVVLPNGTVSLADLQGLTIDTSGPVPVLKASAVVRSRIYVNTISGTGITLSLPNAPLPDTLILHKNGLLWSEGIDYTVSGDTVTFQNGQLLNPGDVINARYQY